MFCNAPATDCDIDALTFDNDDDIEELTNASDALIEELTAANSISVAKVVFNEELKLSNATILLLTDCDNG